jgi:hypothetical protein
VTQLVVNPGACGMTSIIQLSKIDKRLGRLKIDSDCEKVSNLSRSLGEVSLSDALRPPLRSAVYKCATEHCLCASCPIPMSVIKAIEVEFGTALPRDVSVRFEL